MKQFEVYGAYSSLYTSERAIARMRKGLALGKSQGMMRKGKGLILLNNRGYKAGFAAQPSEVIKALSQRFLGARAETEADWRILERETKSGRRWDID